MKLFNDEGPEDVEGSDCKSDKDHFDGGKREQHTSCGICIQQDHNDGGKQEQHNSCDICTSFVVARCSLLF
ncbi:unnamed protein product [Urochloa humidicola]